MRIPSGVTSGGSGLSYDTVAALRAAPAPADGTAATLNGYHVAGDLGGGQVYYDSSRVVEDDGGLVFLGWVRIRDTGSVDPHWFGAVGDGTTDDIDAFDAALAALDVGVYGGGNIDLASGKTYKFSRSWHITKQVVLRGGGTGVAGSATIFKLAVGASIRLDSARTALDAGIPDQRGCSGSVIENFLVQGSVPADWQANHAYTVGQYVTAPDWWGNFTFYVYKCTVAGTSGGSAPAFTVRDRYRGMAVTEGATFTDGGVTWQACSSPGIFMFSQTVIKNVYVEQCPGDGFYLFGTFTFGTNISCFKMEDCIAQLNWGRGMTVEGTDANAGTVNSMLAQNNYAGGYADFSDIGNLYISALAEANGITWWFANNPPSFFRNGITTPTLTGMEIQRVATGGDCFYYHTDSTTGLAGSVEPDWPTTIGATVVDGDLTWTCVGVYRNGQARVDRFEGFLGSTWINCYDEPDQRNSELYQGIWIGEIGGFFSYDSGIWQLRSKNDSNGITQNNPLVTTSPRTKSTLGSPDSFGGALYWAAYDSTKAWRLLLDANSKYWNITEGVSTVRMQLANSDAPEGTGEVVFPNGLFLSGGNGSVRGNRISYVDTNSGQNPPTNGVIGDFCFQKTAGTSFNGYPDGFYCVASYDPGGPTDAVWQSFSFDRKRSIQARIEGTGAPFLIGTAWFFGASGSGSTFSNLGTATKVALKLPVLATRSCIKYTFMVEEPGGAGLRIIAPTGQKIRYGTNVSTTNGYIESVDEGSFITIESVGNADPIWVVTSAVGNWTTA